jgi:hypothetical protein
MEMKNCAACEISVIAPPRMTRLPTRSRRWSVRKYVSEELAVAGERVSGTEPDSSGGAGADGEDPGGRGFCVMAATTVKVSTEDIQISRLEQWTGQH